MKKRLLYLLGRTGAALAVVVAFIVFSGSRQVIFPIWIEADESWMEFSDGIQLEFDHVELTDSKTSAGDPWVEVYVRMTNPTEAVVGIDWTILVEYYSQGRWYDVFWSGPAPAIMYRALDPGATEVLPWWVPLNALEAEGPYRLYLYGLGYCDIPSQRGVFR